MAGYFVRLAMAVLLTALAAAFPPGAGGFAGHAPWFGALAAVGLVTSFTSTLMFTALGSFFNRISDPGAPYSALFAVAARAPAVRAPPRRATAARRRRRRPPH